MPFERTPSERRPVSALVPGTAVGAATRRPPPRRAALVATRAPGAAGVPARVAHPCASGPDGSHTTSAIPAAPTSPRPPSRQAGRSGPPPINRASTATPTATAQARLSGSRKPSRTSLPVSSPWTSASGQQA